MTYRYTQPQHVSAWNHDLPSHVTYDTSLVHKYLQLVPWQTAWVYALCDARAGMEPWSTQRPRESKWAARQWLRSPPFLPWFVERPRSTRPNQSFMFPYNPQPWPGPYRYVNRTTTESHFTYRSVQYLKSCSGDFILQNLILRTRLCDTGFITKHSCVFGFPTDTNLSEGNDLAVYQFWKGISAGPALKWVHTNSME